MTKLTHNYSSSAKYKDSCVLDHIWNANYSSLWNAITRSRNFSSLKECIEVWGIVWGEGGVERDWELLVYCVLGDTIGCGMWTSSVTDLKIVIWDTLSD